MNPEQIPTPRTDAAETEVTIGRGEGREYFHAVDSELSRILEKQLHVAREALTKVKHLNPDHTIREHEIQVLVDDALAQIDEIGGGNE